MRPLALYKELPIAPQRLRKEYPGWHVLIEKAAEKSLTSQDALKIAGVTYRLINDWDSKGLLQTEREQREGWRRFSIFDLFWMAVVKETSDHGIPVSKWRDFLETFVRGLGEFGPKEKLLQMLPLFVAGANLQMWTDFKTYWSITPEGVGLGDLQKALPQGAVISRIPIKQIADRTLAKLDLTDFKAIRQANGGYKFILNSVPLELEPLEMSAEEVRKRAEASKNLHRKLTTGHKK